MKLTIIETGLFKLDGGAMFGVVPKQMWQRMNPADENNMCTWSMRSLLLQDGERNILFDVGLGNKQDSKFMSHFEPHGPFSLTESIEETGLTTEDITDVFITHLHFDHVGGALKLNASGDLIPTFPNAKYWSTKKHFDWAYTPNPREKASFLKENFVPLADLGLLHFIEEEQGVRLYDNIEVFFYHGHTKSMMVPTITTPKGNKLTYCADLLPSIHHVRMPYVMSYDIDPLQTLQEKKAFYDRLLSYENSYLFFEHDPVHPVGQLNLNERGRYEINVVSPATLKDL